MSVCCIKEAGSLAHRFADTGIPVHVCRVRSRLHPTDILRLARFFKTRSIDIVHTHMYAANISGTVAARLARAPVIVSNVHNVGKFSSRRQVLQDRFLARFRSATVCVSERVRDDYLRATGLSGERISVIYNGVDTDMFRPREDRVGWGQGDRLESPSCAGDSLERPSYMAGHDGEARKPVLHREGQPGKAVLHRVRAEFGIGENELVLIAAGRLIPQKSPDLLLSAFKTIHESLPSTRLLMLGTGELHDSLVAMSKKLGLKESVTFAGYREDVAECLAASDIFVSSSVKEGFSNVLLEALASGLPAVVTDVGGNREALRDGREGFLCSPSAENLAERVLTILRDVELRQRMSRMARERAMAFSLEQMANQTAALYDRLLSSERDGRGDG